MSPEKRSALMSRIRGKDTGPERDLARGMAAYGLEWEEHAGDLPGRPDFVFRKRKVAVFVDGDFWHGWHFKEWRDKLTEAWEKKIAENRRRDARNRRALRAVGWTVVRFWEHEIEKGAERCARRLVRLLAKAEVLEQASGASVGPVVAIPSQTSANLVDRTP